MTRKFGENLRRLRRMRGVTQLMLKERLGLGDATEIPLWESGRLLPAPETIAAIAEVLGCDIADLIGAKVILADAGDSDPPAAEERARAPSGPRAARKVRAGLHSSTPAEAGDRTGRSWRIQQRDIRLAWRHSAATPACRSTRFAVT